jgi:hypothetical protein
MTPFASSRSDFMPSWFGGARFGAASGYHLTLGTRSQARRDYLRWTSMPIFAEQKFLD